MISWPCRSTRLSTHRPVNHTVCRQETPVPPCCMHGDSGAACRGVHGGGWREQIPQVGRLDLTVALLGVGQHPVGEELLEQLPLVHLLLDGAAGD